MTSLRQLWCGLFRHRWDIVQRYPMAGAVRKVCFNCKREKLEVVK